MSADLDGFRAWLRGFGLTPGTVDGYVADVRRATEGGRTPLRRLRDEELAPKTRRRLLAALRRYAEFTANERLTKELRTIRLPPARRKTAQVPLTRAQLYELVDAIEGAKDLAPGVRATLGLLACRGLRVGDVLRLRRTELDDARAEGVLAFEAKGRRRLEFRVLKTYRRFIVLLVKQGGDWKRVDELVSPQAKPKGRRLAAARAIERALVRVGVRVGIFGLHPHRLRRTYAVEYLRELKGDPEAMVKLTQHMQWSTMATAMEYVDHARGAELDSVASRIFDRNPKEDT